MVVFLVQRVATVVVLIGAVWFIDRVSLGVVFLYGGGGSSSMFF